MVAPTAGLVVVHAEPASYYMALERDITALLGEFDVGNGRGLVVPSEYAEVVITVA